MAWTDVTLKAAIQSYVEVEDEDSLTTNLNIIITQAEGRILKNIQIPDFRKNATGSMTTGDQYLAIPTDFLSPYSLAITTGGHDFLLFKEVSMIRELYPDPTSTGAPKYYSTWNDDFFIVGPTPDANYAVELHYFHRPESITTASTSWIGTHAESTLLAACLLEAYIFLKGDPDLMGIYTERYKKALVELKGLGEWRNKTDQYRSDNV